MINKIAHLADIHIRKSISRHKEYQTIFNSVYNTLRKDKPDRIVIAGDLYHDFLDLSGEAQLLMASFLNNLARIATVIIQPGNHDIMKKNLNRVNVVDSLTKLINNPNVIYYNQSGFFEDENVVWVVWHHRDKNIKNPWTDVPHQKIKGKTYIDLFHNPIDGCLDQNGKPMRGNYEPVSSFKGDFTFAGDLHYYQVFGKNKNMAYPSSLIQQSFGETPDNHGFIMWDIKNKTHEFINVPNEHVYINFELSENTNYDKLKLESPFIKSEPEIKVKWTDLSSNVNKFNEIKIRQYIKEKYGLEKIRIEKNPIYTNITDIKFVNEGIDINNIDTQREIFREYLVQNQYDENFINEVLALDDIINSRIEVSESNKNVDWKIEKFWFDNFKSYGDGNIIDWDGVNGIIQIHGENQQGKTTILDAICYILYGKTLSTTKVEKFGDGRYLNNKRTLDECSGGALININGERYIISRKSVRSWNRTKTEVTGVKTELEYYKGTEMTEDNKQNDETLKKTQPIIENALGTFKDFIRIVMTNADNLNDLLSMDRSVFMDAIIRDAGYDIFEIKLAEYKKYIKELDEERINIDVLVEEENIKTKEEEYTKLTDKLNDIIESLEVSKENEKSERLNKEDNIKKLHRIDEDLIGLDVETLNNNIVVNKAKIVVNNSSISVIDEANKLIPDVLSFDYDSYKTKKEKLDANSTKISNLRVDISDMNGDIKSFEADIAQTEDKITKVLTAKINQLTASNTKITNETENSKKDVIQAIKDHLATLKEEIQTSKSEIEKIKIKQDAIKETTTEHKNKIAEIEESKVCIECGKPIELDDMEHVRARIKELKDKVGVLHDEYVEWEAKKEPYQKKINSIMERTTKIQNKNFDDEPELKKKYDETLLTVKNNQSTIADNDANIKLLEERKYDTFEDVVKAIDTVNKAKTETEKKLADKKIERDKKSQELSTLNVDTESLRNEIVILDTDKKNFEDKKANNDKRDKLVLENDNLELKIKSDELTIKRIDGQKDKVDENKATQLIIDAIQEKIDSITESINTYNTEKEEVNGNMLLKRTEIDTIKKTIEDFKEQERVDEIRKVYMQSIHRDGLPSYLLKKSIHIINQKLSNLLSNVDFSVFFDDELTLRLSSDNRLDVSQNAVESSGKERTFTAIALKVALREINKKSKPDFVLFDEVMGKLVSGSIDEFIEFLDVVSKEVGKLIIIEHVHQINYDAIIEVTKDSDGISSLEFKS